MTKLTNFLMAWQRRRGEYYHGTPTKVNADKIIEKQSIGRMEDVLIFLTPDIDVATSYALQRWYVNGHPDNEWDRGCKQAIEKFGQYGYVFIIYIKNPEMIDGLYDDRNSEIVSKQILIPNECWQFNRNLWRELKSDCSNFFNLATLYWKRNEQS